MPFSDFPDSELLALVRQGRHDAFTVLVKRHSTTFYRLAYRYLGDRAGAEDVVQSAFLKLWEQPHQWRPERNTKFTTWFYQVVLNLCRDKRKKKHPLFIDEQAPPAEPHYTHEDILLQDEAQRTLTREIAALPERERVALALCFGENLSNQEAAEIMGLSLKALQSLLMRAKSRLKQRMKPYL